MPAPQCYYGHRMKFVSKRVTICWFISPFLAALGCGQCSSDHLDLAPTEQNGVVTIRFSDDTGSREVEVRVPDSPNPSGVGPLADFLPEFLFRSAPR